MFKFFGNKKAETLRSACVGNIGLSVQAVEIDMGSAISSFFQLVCFLN
uniref:Uncharacterized protein n=1 Tax=Rhizophora mucronata TaxID=61149 RepID=A0A2P2IMA1_RHIMU